MTETDAIDALFSGQMPSPKPMTYEELAKRSKAAKAKRKAGGTEKIVATGVPFTVLKTGGLSFECPRGVFFPSTQRWQDMRADGLTVKIGADKFARWIKANVGNPDALPPGAEENRKKTLGFGKHKGQRIDEVPHDYLIWMAETFDKNQFGSDDPRKQTAILELMRRERIVK